MQSLTLVAQWILRLTGLFQLVTGFAFWLGYWHNLTSDHMVSGVILTVMLWLLALLGGFSDVSKTLVAVALLWGVLLVMLGFSQMSLMVGDAHWVIQVLHLLVGLGGMGLGEAIARRIRRPAAAPA